MAERRHASDGRFVVAVRTTGIFCRPTCPARTPLRANVEYFRHGEDAMAAGYRACKRCRPLEPAGAHPRWVRDLLARIEGDSTTRISDRELGALGIDPVRARRYFRDRFAMTFQAYQRLRRLGVAFDAINRGEDLMQVAFASGFESNSGFREAFRRMFGQPPGRARGARCLSVSLLTTPIGSVVAAATVEMLSLVEFGDRPALATEAATINRRLQLPVVIGTNDMLEQLRRELEEYFQGRRTRFTVPLDMAGTPFQRAVWSELLKIPFGETTSYATLAGIIGRSGAQRAVGKANGDNRHAVLVPCHRVINSAGKLHGYGGGSWRKQFLLEHELRIYEKLGRADAGS
jgi:AraC family transcriptional regulator, regulatory protein of adaptative response / methylated-DNA-[protein]-cysteine methyltransferase